MLKYALLVALVLATGCVQQIDFGQNQINVATPVTEETSDIVAINNIDTIPNSPVLPDDGVDMSFVIQNLDKSDSLKDVNVDLFDAASFKSTSSTLCNIAALETRDGNGNILMENKVVCAPEGVNIANCQGNKCSVGSLPPGSQLPINYKLKAPSSGDILGLSTDFEIRFAVEHGFTANSIYRPIVVNVDEITALQRAGQKVALQAASTLGSGPIKIDLSLVDRNFILNRRGATFEAVVRHTGSGRLLKNEIEPGRLNITFVGIPCSDFDTSSGSLNDAFTSKDDIVNLMPSCIFINTESAIQIYSQGKSNPLLFRLLDDNKNVIDIGANPYRSYEVRATANYTYRVSGVAQVTVKPLTI